MSPNKVKDVKPQEGMENKETTIEEIQNKASEENESVQRAVVEKTELQNMQKQLDEAESLADSFKDQLLRLAAEFENFKKRVEVNKAEFVKYSNERMMKDLIPVLDDFERALANGKKNPEQESFQRGVELIYQKLYKLLQDKGLEPIDSVGKEFDVTYHDVLMQVPRQDVKPDTIIDEVERGYTLHGKVIKHAKVIVASAANTSPAPDQGE